MVAKNFNTADPCVRDHRDLWIHRSTEMTLKDLILSMEDILAELRRLGRYIRSA